MNYKEVNYKNSDRVKFGPYEADLHTHELWKFGLKVNLCWLVCST